MTLAFHGRSLSTVPWHVWCMALLLACADVAAQPITRVYRADSRPPDVVFQQGFLGRGANMDLLAHALGGSCDDPDPERASLWVSTSADRAQATGFARDRLEDLQEHGPATAWWIYTIRADHTYMSIPAMLRRVEAAGSASSGGYTPEHARSINHILYHTLVMSEAEVVAHYVDPRNIVSAVRVYYDAHEDWVEDNAVSNARYVDLPTSVGGDDELQEYVPASGIRPHEDSGSDADSDSCSMACDSASSASSFASLASGTDAARLVCSRRPRASPLIIDLILDDVTRGK